MRNAARWVIASIGAGAIAIIACGGSSENPPTNNTTPDAGNDVNVPDTNVPDTNVPDTNVPDTAIACVDADLTTIQLPDASLDDAGASTGTCTSCVNAKCSSDVTACQNDCDCRNTLACIYQNCLGDFGNFQALGTCAANANCIDPSAGFGAVPAGLISLAGCLNTNCDTQCGVPPTPDGGGDAGSDASDAKAD